MQLYISNWSHLILWFTQRWRNYNVMNTISLQLSLAVWLSVPLSHKKSSVADQAAESQFQQRSPAVTTHPLPNHWEGDVMATETRGHSWCSVSVGLATAVSSPVSCGAIGMADVSSVESTEGWLECGINFFFLSLCVSPFPLLIPLPSPFLLPSFFASVIPFLRWGSTSQTCTRTWEMDTTWSPCSRSSLESPWYGLLFLSHTLTCTNTWLLCNLLFQLEGDSLLQADTLLMAKLNNLAFYHQYVSKQSCISLSSSGLTHANTMM